jgi:ectoine hydroxylase-related dioxygenase (phytanoyl-CoA dioxygenase family)
MSIEAVIDDYDRDGAAVLRSAISPGWIGRLSREIDLLMADGRHGRNMGREGEGRFHGDSFLWLRSQVMLAFLRQGRLAEVAAAVMGSGQVRFFMDQLLVKEPGALKHTPWHQDLLYWPLRGEQILSIWIPLDPATPETGVVTYVKGSHRWDGFLQSGPFADDDSDGHSIAKVRSDLVNIDAAPLNTLTDIRQRPHLYSFLSWNVQPGDVILHHPMVVHGAPGNMSANQRRRAWATRWLGEDVRWDDSRPHFLERFAADGAFPYPKLVRGDPLDDDRIFPLLRTPGGK